MTFFLSFAFSIDFGNDLDGVFWSFGGYWIVVSNVKSSVEILPFM